MHVSRLNRQGGWQNTHIQPSSDIWGSMISYWRTQSFPKWNVSSCQTQNHNVEIYCPKQWWYSIHQCRERMAPLEQHLSKRHNTTCQLEWAQNLTWWVLMKACTRGLSIQLQKQRPKRYQLQTLRWKMSLEIAVLTKNQRKYFTRALRHGKDRWLRSCTLNNLLMASLLAPEKRSKGKSDICENLLLFLIPINTNHSN